MITSIKLVMFTIIFHFIMYVHVTIIIVYHNSVHVLLLHYSTNFMIMTDIVYYAPNNTNNEVMD